MKKQDATLNAAIGERLIHHRTRRKITIEKLAELVGVSVRYLQDLQRGNVGMSLTTLKRVCDVLEISADSLLYGETAGIDALLRGADREKIEAIEELVQLQLKIIKKVKKD